MKVYVQAPANVSLAMHRVAGVLFQTAPQGVEIVDDMDAADLLVLHVIALDALDYRTDKRCAVIQYCSYTGTDSYEQWRPLWERSLATWSYYDLPAPRFYRAPMGVSHEFALPFTEGPRDVGIFTSGFVTGPGAEAIEECCLAADALGLKSLHLGPRPSGMRAGVTCNSTGIISDQLLAHAYRRSRYVSGLRFVEGFEMPALEGLACGARPIMFDRPSDRYWFGDHAHFVPECHGEELVERLIAVLEEQPEIVDERERQAVLERFNWTTIAVGFWQRIMEGL